MPKKKGKSTSVNAFACDANYIIKLCYKVLNPHFLFQKNISDDNLNKVDTRDDAVKRNDAEWRKAA